MKWRDLEVRASFKLLSPEGHHKKVEAEALAPASGRHSTIIMLEPGKKPHPLSAKLEKDSQVGRRDTYIGKPQEAKAESIKEAPLVRA